MKVSPPYPGFFVVLEGIDGAGKSTQAKLLGERLTSHGRRVVLSREPTMGQYGKLLRESAQSGRQFPFEWPAGSPRANVRGCPVRTRGAATAATTQRFPETQ